MYSITVALPQTQWALFFKEQKTAEEVFLKLESEPMVRVHDDFGQRLQVRREQVNGVLFEDLEMSRMAHIERALHQARTQVKAEQMSQADPVLRASAMTRGNGPAVLSPMGHGAIPRR